VPLVGGQVADGAGDQGWEFAEVVRLWGPAAAPDLQEPHDGQVEVEGQAVGPVGDGAAHLGADQRLPALGQAAGEMGIAVLGGEVADQDLPYGGAALGAGAGQACGEVGPGGGAGPVELSL
jgi:hypothetical protein